MGHFDVSPESIPLINRIRCWLAWPLLVLFTFLILSSTGAQLHGRLLIMGDWLFGDYYLIRGDIPAPNCNVNPDIESQLLRLKQNAAADSSGLNALFGEAPVFNEAKSRKSLEKARQLCKKKQTLYEESKVRVTPAVQVFRAIEVGLEFFTLFLFDYQRVFIIALLFLGGLCATLGQHHISFRPIQTLFQHRFTHGVELAALLGLFLPSVYAFFQQKQNQLNAGVEGFEPLILFGVVLMSGFTLWRLLAPPAELIQRPKEPLSLASSASALLRVPIYVYMLLIAGYYFMALENHTTGLAIYTGQLFEQAEMFLKVGLYIWLGMLLKRSQLGHKIFDVLRPLGLSPEILAFLAVLLMAVPTAYTGASGIIIIAMGAVVFKELSDSGARPSLALAATAMTGSSGVVLRPCLIIVIIAALNKDVVTSDLYTWGGRVFVLSSLIFLVFLGFNKSVWRMAPWCNAKQPVIKALQALIMPVALFIGVAAGYSFILDAKLDEMSAPIILPVILLAILWFEQRQLVRQNSAPAQAGVSKRVLGLVQKATEESSLHVGGLLLLMAFSFTIGGVIERTEMVGILPELFQSTWTCMALLVILLVFIGMVMDPFGAVVLVSGSIAAVAYNNGIVPLHFWMVTLVAFELGYLTPPVALNHLLTRQVVGELNAQKAHAAAALAPTFWLRHEKILLPLCVTAVTLLITAFVPLLF